MEQLKNIGRELAIGSQGSSKEFLELVKAIGEAKSKAEEERLVMEEIEMLKKKIVEPDVPRKRMKEYIVRLVYVEMLGHDASFGYIQAVKMTHDDNLLLKRTGYLAVTLFLNEDHDLIILIINTIQKDLRSDNYLVCCAALTAVCKLINEETIPAVLPQVVELLGHQKEAVRKKAVMALHRFHQRSPATVADVISKLSMKIMHDVDPSVMSACLCVLFDLISADANSYRHLTNSYVCILKQVVEHRLPKQYNYHNAPAPFIQIKLLKILALLGTGDKGASNNMYNVLGDVLKKAEPSGNIGNALIYECISTITAIHPNSKLLESAAAQTSRFLKSESHNLKYMGIDALGRIIKINPDFAEEHQLAVIDCLEDPDDTLKRKTLELLYKMTKSSNVEVIVDRMICYMKTLTDSHYKTDIASRCIELAERFAPSNQWFIQVTMNQVFEHAGDLVPPKVAHDLMRLIAEGAGEEDEDADSELRSSAVESYLQILVEPKLPSLLLQVICWVLGEYGTADGTHSAAYIIERLCDVAEAHPGDDVVKGYAISAITKVCSFEIAAGKKVHLIPECQAFIDELSASHSTDLQQRAYELQALFAFDSSVVGAVLPFDGSADDIEVDQSLPFLNHYVKSMLSKGAKPYIPANERQAATTLASQHVESYVSSHSLRFDPYEKPQMPIMALTPVTTLQSDDQSIDISQKATQVFQPSFDADTPSSEATRLRLEGVQRKWGRPSYNNNSASSSAGAERSTNGASNGLDIEKASGGKQGIVPQEPKYVSDRNKQPEISAEKQKLAASLFGGVTSKADSSVRSSGRSQKQASTNRHVGTAKRMQTVDPVDSRAQASLPAATAPPDLLDFGEEEVAIAASSKDPMKDLEGLFDNTGSVPSSQPTAPVTNLPNIDLMSLYDSDLGLGSGLVSSIRVPDMIPENLPNNDSGDRLTVLDGLVTTSGAVAGPKVQGETSASSAIKKGPSLESSLEKHARSRQVGVTPTGPHPDLFKDLLK
ncbi:hypothetical protein KP509_09G002800 [Ceratopteris richardii]|uniref:AP-4 complex subunit epsilon n=1 Tax=Ceratopteris richardii TaxID=49495 RepID=A0A8T2U7E7_CERRI|nr:hypothetical protein KP509_09G002800 [Ceratopteris richardii]KAH7428461.1 hypothetical protein KP509_09G002800 [Ceratopteris richardii]